MEFMDYSHFSDEELREILIEFYKKHDPDEIEFIDDVLNLAFELGPAEIDMKLGELYGETLTQFKGGYAFNPINKEGLQAKVLRVSIIGGGYAGAACAKYLERTMKNRKLIKVKITLIDSRKGAVHKYAGSRAAVLGNNFAYRAVIPNQNILSGGNVINKAVRFVEDDKVIFEDSSELAFDYLVCATGARYVSPCEPPLGITEVEEMINWYCEIEAAISWARNIVVVGGGANGIELCGEIKSIYKDKSVTFLHRGKDIVENFNPPCNSAFHKKLLKQADSLNIRVLPGERVTNLNVNEFTNKPYLSGLRKLTTSSGATIEADLVLVFGAKRLNNEIYRNSWLNEIGLITVEPTLQIRGHPNIFAIGDINDIEENKQGYLAQMQGEVAAKNINKLLTNPNTRRLNKYKPSRKTTLMVAMGKKNGASNLGRISAGASVTGRLKGNDLFVKQTWGIYNQSDGLLPENIRNWKEHVSDGITKKKTEAENNEENFLHNNTEINEDEILPEARSPIISYGRNIIDFDEIHKDLNASDTQLLEEENAYELEEEQMRVRHRKKKKKKKPGKRIDDGKVRKPRKRGEHRAGDQIAGNLQVSTYESSVEQRSEAKEFDTDYKQRNEDNLRENKQKNRKKKYHERVAEAGFKKQQQFIQETRERQQKKAEKNRLSILAREIL